MDYFLFTVIYFTIFGGATKLINKTSWLRYYLGVEEHYFWALIGWGIGLLVLA